MKKQLLFALAAVFAVVGATAQEIGVKAGYILVTAEADVEGFSASTDGSGFFFGVTGELPISETFSVQPEALYANAEDTGFLYIPVMAKYYVTPEFSIQAGPQVNWLLDADDLENEFGLDIAFGLEYKIVENFFIDARYGFEVTNRLSDEDFDGMDVKGRYNALMIGVGYRF